MTQYRDDSPLITKSTTEEGNTQSRFWMCYVAGIKPFVSKRLNYQEALLEAERLAKLSDYTGEDVVVFEAKRICRVRLVPGVRWTTLE